MIDHACPTRSLSPTTFVGRRSSGFYESFLCFYSKFNFGEFIKNCRILFKASSAARSIFKQVLAIFMSSHKEKIWSFSEELNIHKLRYLSIEHFPMISSKVFVAFYNQQQTIEIPMNAVLQRNPSSSRRLAGVPTITIKIIDFSRM